MEREGLAMYAGALTLGLEGIVAKDSKSLYVEGPAVTWHWQKNQESGVQTAGESGVQAKAITSRLLEPSFMGL